MGVPARLNRRAPSKTRPSPARTMLAAAMRITSGSSNQDRGDTRWSMNATVAQISSHSGGMIRGGDVLGAKQPRLEYLHVASPNMVFNKLHRTLSVTTGHDKSQLARKCLGSIVL